MLWDLSVAAHISIFTGYRIVLFGQSGTSRTLCRFRRFRGTSAHFGWISWRSRMEKHGDWTDKQWYFMVFSLDWIDELTKLIKTGMQLMQLMQPAFLGSGSISGNPTWLRNGMFFQSWVLFCCPVRVQESARKMFDMGLVPGTWTCFSLQFQLGKKSLNYDIYFLGPLQQIQMNWRCNEISTSLTKG